VHRSFFRYHLQTDLDVLIDLQHFQQIAETVFKQDGQDLPVAIKVPIGPADDTDFSDTEHELSRKSCPNGLGIDFPIEGLFWPLDSQWQNAILGIKSGPPQADEFQICDSYLKLDLIPPTPVFQHSSIPTFQQPGTNSETAAL
jgi:hypothetical protein